MTVFALGIGVMPEYFGGLMTFDDLMAQSLTPEKLRRFLAAYHDAQGPDGVGLQDRLSMRAIAPMLGNVTLMEIKDHQTFIYRIVGENITSRMGFNPTGKNFFDFIEPETHEETAVAFHAALTQPSGHYALYENQYESGRRMVTESLMLPIRKNSRADANYVLGYHVHHQATDTYSLGARTTFFVDWSISEFFDIGFGVPDLVVAQAASTAPSPPIRQTA